MRCRKKKEETTERGVTRKYSAPNVIQIGPHEVHDEAKEDVPLLPSKSPNPDTPDTPNKNEDLEEAPPVLIV
ncbi:hypothetical protein PFISCL1PPCAC_17761 [Pristionchus fissidentatus]|uniref:Uncharacterized protein n=1 Tax=Pristionchus fissidentatus TaxID=1538716 RepID=A0AAV5W3F2_9BILA|nr:hypothetical protein PFISCL1PPCAC_17761 [Pristionchus fissidentatus]